jgi:hypothetical protein
MLSQSMLTLPIHDVPTASTYTAGPDTGLRISVQCSETIKHLGSQHLQVEAMQT